LQELFNDPFLIHANRYYLNVFAGCSKNAKDHRVLATVFPKHLHGVKTTPSLLTIPQRLRLMKGRSAIVICPGRGHQYPNIFKLFNRLVRMEEFEGTGAGLAIAKKVLEKQGGRLWAESAPGQGATFFVELPKPRQGA